MKIPCYFFNALVLLLLSVNALADTTGDSAAKIEQLAKEAQNPVAKLISVPFNNNFNFGEGYHRTTQYVLDIKPVVPFSLTEDWNLITRTIIPVISQPTTLTPNSRSYMSGLGDITPTVFISPAKPGNILWGVGPAMTLPTATNRQLGQGKYSLGPSFVVLSMPGHWVYGFLAYNLWSVGGQVKRDTVNQFQLQYFINYNFPRGWYLTTQPIITANWLAKADDQWVVPLGLGLGRVFHVGKQALNMSFQAYDNVKTTATLGPQWQAQFNVSFLFPKS